jgi:hypothetical protein
MWCAGVGYEKREETKGPKRGNAVRQEAAEMAAPSTVSSAAVTNGTEDEDESNAGEVALTNQSIVLEDHGLTHIHILSHIALGGAVRSVLRGIASSSRRFIGGSFPRRVPIKTGRYMK